MHFLFANPQAQSNTYHITWDTLNTKLTIPYNLAKRIWTIIQNTYTRDYRLHGIHSILIRRHYKISLMNVSLKNAISVCCSAEYMKRNVNENIKPSMPGYISVKNILRKFNILRGKFGMIVNLSFYFYGPWYLRKWF